MHIAGRQIGRGHAPYIIAEMSANHNGSLDRAYRIIDAAKEAGADAIKFQLFDPWTLSESRGGVNHIVQSGPWKGMTLFDLYSRAWTPPTWFEKLIAHCAINHITWFSSVFSTTGIDLLEQLETPAIKVSSFEAANENLIVNAAAAQCPLIISTGMADDDEIDSAVRSALNHGAEDVALLHCVSAYPTPIGKANLRRIEHLSKTFHLQVGWSDHVLGDTAAIAAVALGATIVEKHLTLSRDDGGLDASFSMEPAEFRDMIWRCNDAWAACLPVEQIQPYADLKVVA